MSLTKQEIFTKVRNHLLIQKKKAAYGHRCQYQLLTPKGILKCAVGCLIADKFYTSRLEGQTADNPLVMVALMKSGVPIDASIIDLISRLQTIHDRMEVVNWEYALDRLAKEEELKIETIIPSVIGQSPL